MLTIPSTQLIFLPFRGYNRETIRVVIVQLILRNVDGASRGFPNDVLPATGPKDIDRFGN